MRINGSFTGWPGTDVGENDFNHVESLVLGDERTSIFFYEDSSGDAGEIRPMRLHPGPNEGTFFIDLADPEHPDEFEITLLLTPA